MSSTNYGGNESTKPNLKLEGKQILVESIGCYDGSIPVMYRKETIYHFKTKEEAKEYYYKKK